MNFIDDWMDRKDFERCSQIDGATALSAAAVWQPEDFAGELREENMVGRVLKLGNEIIGFYIYWLQKKRIILLHLAVEPSYQRRGAASAMLERLKHKLRPGRKEAILVPCRESSLALQLFLKKQGFKAVKILHKNFIDTDEDSYLFIFSVAEVVEPQELTMSEF